MQRHTSAVTLRSMFLLLCTSFVIAHARGSTNMADEVLHTEDNHCQPILVNGELMPTVPGYMSSFPVALKGIKRHFVCKLAESTTTQDTTTKYTTESATSHPTTTTHEIEGGIRLVDGYSSDEGRVEIFHEGQWGTVCDDGWDDSDARVVCRQLGYSGNVGVAWRDAPTYGRGSGPMYLSNVDCSGNESRLTDCSNAGWGNHDCRHSEDAGVYCGDEIEGEIRLNSWYSSDGGRVEIFHDGQWGSVCGDGWDDSDARVVCRQLGYSSYSTGNNGVAWTGAAYGRRSGPIYLGYVDCSGNETRLTDCSNWGWDKHDCEDSEYAGVYCWF